MGPQAAQCAADEECEGGEEDGNPMTVRFSDKSPSYIDPPSEVSSHHGLLSQVQEFDDLAEEDDVPVAYRTRPPAWAAGRPPSPEPAAAAPVSSVVLPKPDSDRSNETGDDLIDQANDAEDETDELRSAAPFGRSKMHRRRGGRSCFSVLDRLKQMVGLVPGISATAHQSAKSGNGLDFALDLLELSLSVCMSNASDCILLSQVASPKDCAALGRLADLMHQIGLMDAASAKGPSELAHTFLGSTVASSLGQAGSKKIIRQVSFGFASSSNPQNADTLLDGGPLECIPSNSASGVTGGQSVSDPELPVQNGSAEHAAPPPPRSEAVYRSRSSSIRSLNSNQALRRSNSNVSLRSNSSRSLNSRNSPGGAKGGATGSFAFGDRQRASFRRSGTSRSSFGSNHSSAASGTEFSVTSFGDFNRRRSGLFRVGTRAAPPLVAQAPDRKSAASSISFLDFIKTLGGDAGAPYPRSAMRPQDPAGESGLAKDAGRPAPDQNPLPPQTGPPQNVPQSGRMPLAMEIPLADLVGPETLDAMRAAAAGSRPVGGGGGGVRLRVPAEDRSLAGASEVSGASGITYHSSCDAILMTQGNDPEAVRADILNLGQGNGSSQVRIEFDSKCLRTQNEWQRQLLTQQRALLDTISVKLQDAQQALHSADVVREEEKELLRGFRKIITREKQSDAHHSSVDVFVVEKNGKLGVELQELCDILEYRCQVFKSLSAAKDAVEEAGVSNERRDRFQRSSTSRSTLSTRTTQSGRSTSSLESKSDHVQVVFLGSAWVNRELPLEWKDGVFVVLTSEPEEFEEVGRKLFASSEAEIRDRLRGRGICDYMLHPLTMDGIRKVVDEANRRQFGHEFLLTTVIGRGSFGIVYRAKRLRDGKMFALKAINTKCLGKLAQEDLENETDLLRTLEWPTVIHLVDSWVVSRDRLRYLLMGLQKGGDLAKKTEAARSGTSPILVERAMDWYAQAVHGVSYMHSRGVLHRDVKPHNLVLGEDERSLQIADLGNAVRLPGPGPHPSSRNSIQGRPCTPFYSSPEALLEQVHLAASDIWSMGASFFEVLTLKPVFPADMNMEQLLKLVARFDTTSTGASGRSGRNCGSDSAVDVTAALQLGGGPMRREFGKEIVELLQRDPLQRPQAATLALRPSNAQRIQVVLAETGDLAEDYQARTLHFEEFERILQQSRLAADLEPPEDCAYPPMRKPGPAGDDKSPRRRRPSN